MSKQSKQPISKTPWFVITLLIVFFPVGLYLMWHNNLFKEKTRFIVSGVLAFFLVVGLFSPNTSADSSTQIASKPTPTAVAVTPTPTSAPTPTPTPKPTPTPTPAPTPEPTIEQTQPEEVPAVAAVDEPAAASEYSAPASSGTYIGNTNTGKFHRPSCHTLPKEKNRIYFDSRDEAISSGYDPCKNCDP